MRKLWIWIINFCLNRIEKESGLVAHAKHEFAVLGYDLDDKEEGPNKWIMENVIALISLFGSQGHSGSSAPFCVSYFKDLASWKPLTPLTGGPEEWNEVGDDLFQNKRCSYVFMKKARDGANKPGVHEAYDINGKVFREPGGGCYISGDSRVPVTFPYTPKTEYVDVPGAN